MHLLEDMLVFPCNDAGHSFETNMSASPLAQATLDPELLVKQSSHEYVYVLILSFRTMNTFSDLRRTIVMIRCAGPWI